MSGPLSGLRVVDLTRVVAGPYATMLLGDMGAEIIKIELPRRGDDGRYGYPDLKGVPLAFLALNRNKKGITLDVRKPEGASLLRRIVAESDILVENFSAGTMDGWGVGYHDLSPSNPRLIYAALSGFGQTGPYAGRTSYDIIAQAMGGLMSLTGLENGPPMRGGGALADFIGGVFTALGVTCALHHRDRTGEGQFVDVSNMDAILSMTDNWLTITAMTGRIPERMGNRHPFTAPYDCFRALDGWVVIGVGNSALFRTLVKAIGQEALGSDPRFKAPASRLEHHDEINGILGEWVGQRTVAEVMDTLGPAGANIPCAPVLGVDSLLNDPHVRARNMAPLVMHPRLGEVPVTGVPIKLSRSPGEVLAPGPELGQHNSEIYEGLLGLCSEEMDLLRKNGVI